MLLATLTVLGTTFVALTRSTPAPADQNPSNTLCKGHIKKGEADPDFPENGRVEYRFACSQAITGYTLLPEKEVQGYETEIFATDAKTGNVIATDAFGCTGDQPGYGVNCTGTYGGSWNTVTGTFDIAGDVCAEPRVDPLLIVTYATKNSKGDVQQYIAGPFDLGRPRGCPKTGRGGKLRIPRDSEESTVAPAPAG